MFIGGLVMISALRALFVASALLIPSPAVFAASEDAVTVDVNMARILRLRGPAGTVVIGNPGVADVTIQDPRTLVLTGKSYGRTNLIVLGSDGEPIADTIIEVVQSQDEILTLFVGSARTTLACAPVCQPTIMLGDSQDFTSSAIASQSLVESSIR